MVIETASRRNLGLRPEQPAALLGVERRERGDRELVGDAVELGDLRAAASVSTKRLLRRSAGLGRFSTRPSRSSERMTRER